RPRRGAGAGRARARPLRRLPGAGGAGRRPGGPDRGHAADLRPARGPGGDGPAGDRPALAGAGPERGSLARVHVDRPDDRVLHDLPGRLLHHDGGLRHVRRRPAGAAAATSGAGVTWLAIQPASWNLLADLREILAYDFMRHAFLAGTGIAL